MHVYLAQEWRKLVEVIWTNKLHDLWKSNEKLVLWNEEYNEESLQSLYYTDKKLHTDLYCICYFSTILQYRRALKKSKAGRYSHKVEAKMSVQMRKPEVTYHMDPTDEVFQTVKVDSTSKKK